MSWYVYLCACLLRSWSNHLNLEIMTSPWSLEEDMFIIEVGVAYTSIVVLLSSTCLSSQNHRVKGLKWEAIADLLPGRTENAIKNRWNSTLVHLLQRQEMAAQSRLAVLEAGFAVNSATNSRSTGAAAHYEGRYVNESVFLEINMANDIDCIS